MCEKYVNDDFAAARKRLASANVLLIITHARPDGDALGSMAALARAAEAAGKKVLLLVPDKVPPRYQHLFGTRLPAGPDQFQTLADRADTIVIVDTCAMAQLDNLAEHLRPRREKIVVIDHHATADDVGAVQWSDETAAAAGIMVGEMIEALGWPADLAAMEAMTIAVVTDTGWLRFANTDGRCLRAVAGWLDAGVRADVLFRKLYQCDRPQRLELIVRTLQSLELHCRGRLAAMTIRKADFEATGTRGDETENLVNEALRLASVETAMLLVEMPDAVRVSLRSRDAVDVSAVAGRFGGGGHKRAAGLRADEDIDQLKARLIAACTEALNAAGGGTEA